MPSALAEQLVGMGGQVVITRTTTSAGGSQQVYFVSADMPANARTATDGVVTHHAGIQGGADLDPAAHAWRDPVAEITIQRVRSAR